MALNFTNNQNIAPGSMPPPAATPNQAQQSANPVEELLINYTEKFRKATPAKYRDDEIFKTVSQLMMSQKTSTLLVGDAGVGKTKIVEEIARLIANKSPYTTNLNDYKLYELPLTNLISGTSYRGQLEEKVKMILEYCETEKVILFIDEIHQLVGENSSYDSVAQMFKPAMARGSIKIIGATTTQESKNLLDDPAFNRRFNRVSVRELSIEQTRDIIETVYIPIMSNFYSIGFAKDIAKTVVAAAERSKTITNHRPDNAITLLDKVCANTVLRRNYNISVCDDENIRTTMKSTPLVINQKHVEDFCKDDGFVIPSSFDIIKQDIFFRDKAIDKAYKTISDYINMSALFPDRKPFVLDIKGNSGAGRTTVAKKIGELIDESAIYLDLSDYSDAPSLNRIIGSPAGYVGFNSKKEMPFDTVESNPRHVIILDNADKCHPVVSEFFRSAIDTAVIKYADNRLVDISKCLIIRITEQSKASGAIGFASKAPKSSDSEIILEVLTDDEMIEVTEKMISNMLAELKSSHSKYNSLPDEIKLTHEQEMTIQKPADMIYVARRVILDNI